MTASVKAKWLRFLILVLGGGTIYKLSNLKDAFYIPMQEHMGLTHTQIGTLLSVNAIVATALFATSTIVALEKLSRVRTVLAEASAESLAPKAATAC